MMVDCHWRVYCEDINLDELTSFMTLFREMTRTRLSEHDEHHWGPLLGVERRAFREHGFDSIRQNIRQAPILKSYFTLDDVSVSDK